MEVNGVPAPAAPSEPRSLRPLFAPRSVAVVGASEDVRKWGNWLARGALRGADRRSVYLVNRRADQVLGQPAYRSLAELPERPELVAIAVPHEALSDTVDAALAAGAGAIVAISAGDPNDGSGLEPSLAHRVRAAGAVLLGPNCLGVLDNGEGLELMSGELPPGPIGLISQSGNVALEVGLLAERAALGFSRFASLGNQADLGAAELVAGLAGHEETRLIALYVEDFRDGRAFARTAASAVEAGKPVVVLAVDRSGATARAVRSHTGALASDGAAIEAACRAAGIERVHTPAELVDTAQALLRCPPAAGRRVAILSDGGGHASIAAAECVRRGLELPLLGPELQGLLGGWLPAGAATSNPVDLAGAAERDVAAFARVADVLLGSGEIDALILTGYFGGYFEYGDAAAVEEVRVAERLGDVARAHGRPLVLQTMYPHGPVAAAARSSGVAVYEAVEQAAAALARLCCRSGGGRAAVPHLPEPAPAVDGDGYEAARALLAASGIPFVAQRTVSGLEEALAAAPQLGFPVVLKALGRLHKSDGGGVVVGLADEAALTEAFAEMAARLSPESYSLEAMAPVAEGVELLIGVRWDPRFGPVALAGAGGITAEVLRDTAVALAPVSEPEAVRLLDELRVSALLRGARGRPPLDVGGAARALARLSELAAAHPELPEIEINPLLVCAEGVVALDARFTTTEEPSPWTSPTPPSSSPCASAPSA